MEEFKDSRPPEELLHNLKLSDQKSSESTSSLATGAKDAQNLKNTESGYIPSSAKEPTTADECFHDCHDSFEATESKVDDEGNLQNDENSSRKQTELDEEYLLELEKDMPEEEKQKRRKESTTLKEKGNEQFKKGDYGEAEDSYTRALQICPACFQKDRAVLFSNRAAAKMKQDKTEAALSDCSKAVELDPNYIRALLRRAELYEKTEKLDEALEDYKTILEKDPSIHQAREACMRLPRQIEERNEKLKKEMLEFQVKSRRVLKHQEQEDLSKYHLKEETDTAPGQMSVWLLRTPFSQAN
uniref:Tetratricopeptide repeat protein 1 n=1 Tax=Apteryx owenii TaxID=8824 RepID=A0A8B9P658_APTOW